MQLKTGKALGLKPLPSPGKVAVFIAPLCDFTIQSPASETPRVQELHLPIYHAICTVVEDTFSLTLSKWLKYLIL